MTREPDHTTIITLIRLLLREEGVSPFCQDTLKGEFSRQLAAREERRKRIDGRIEGTPYYQGGGKPA
jgi:hypothetical protein